MKQHASFFIGIFSIFAITGGIVLRFNYLDSPFWADEFTQINISSQSSLKEVIELHKYTNTEPPLFSVLLYFWLKINTSVSWSRLLPSLLGVITLIYAYKTARVLKFPFEMRLLLTAFVAVGPVFVHYSEEVRVYSLSILSTFAMIYYFIVLAQTASTANTIKFTIAHLVGIFSHYGNWLFAPLVFFWLLSTKDRSYLKPALYYFCAVCAVCTFLVFSQLQYQSKGFSEDYLAIHKLNYVGLNKLPMFALKKNIDFVVYSLGATPWHKDINYFPVESPVYYAGFLMLAGVFVYIIRDINNIERLIVVAMIIMLVAINTISLFGIYAVGPVRMSLFYAPLLIVSFFIFVNKVYREVSLLWWVIIAGVLFLILNSSARLYRMPHRHIGENFGIILCEAKFPPVKSI